MTIDFVSLEKVARLRIVAKLEVDMGTRFQPTGFPDLGPAEFELPNGKAGLLVESCQSMANRLEMGCWDEVNNDWNKPLQGLPVIKVVNKVGEPFTNSVLESHRINSPYILGGKDESLLNILKVELAPKGIGAANFRKLYKLLLMYDPNTLIHGVFLARKDLANGRYKLPRALTAFIDAEDVNIASSGGVKFDYVNPSGNTALGFGHVPFHRDEYTSPNIYASFKLDLAQVRGYGLGKAAENFLIAFALYKIQKLLFDGLCLRTACEFVCIDLDVKSPEGWTMPSLAEIEKTLPSLIKAVSDEGKFKDTNGESADRSTIIIYEEKEDKKDKKSDTTSDEMVDE